MSVLLVEDDDLVRELVTEGLRDHGYPVVGARDGEEAIDLIDNPPRLFSVLITDFHMPGSRNGCEVAAHLRRRLPTIPVFIITARPDVIHNSCSAAAPYVLVPKPFTLGQLLGHVAPLIEP